MDVLHVPFNFGLPWSTHCPRVLTLHDAIESIYYQPKLSPAARLAPGRLKLSFYHRLARIRAHQVITVSHHAKTDIVQHLGVPEERVQVVYEAADPAFHEPLTMAQLAGASGRNLASSGRTFCMSAVGKDVKT